MKNSLVIGVMSGTSLDGVDIVYCEFSEDSDKWTYKILFAETIPYDKSWEKSLSNLENSSAQEFVQLHNQYGHYTGRLISDFINRYGISPDFIASHGHTIFHQPENKTTFQIGNGAAIAAECGIPVVCDFRATDISLGGQGAPLVPLGDNILFASFDYCLNLGGFANISYEDNGRRIAYDICPVNIVLNKIVRSINKDYDHNGEIASKGNINDDLLAKLNDLAFYKEHFPKSLGKEEVVQNY